MRATLTNQELKVANLLGVGYSDKEAADILNCSNRTIINHKAHIFEKLQINKVTELVIWHWCMKTGIEFDLKELRKQIIALFFFIIITPTISSIDVKPRARRVRFSRNVKQTELITA